MEEPKQKDWDPEIGEQDSTHKTMHTLIPLADETSIGTAEGELIRDNYRHKPLAINEVNLMLR